MRYGIVINMDYDSHPYEAANLVFEEIRELLLQRGFRQDGRIFSIDLPGEEACALARAAVDEVNDYEEHRDKDLYTCMREFYGFEIANVVNLLVPGVGEIRVAELDVVPDNIKLATDQS